MDNDMKGVKVAGKNSVKNSSAQNSVLILHDIRSVVNVGAIFRTADAIGISKIYLTGYTPAPIDRFGRERADFKKSALGAEKSVTWEQIDFSEKDAKSGSENATVKNLISKLKKEAFKIVALEQSENSVDYKKVTDDVKVGEKIAVVLGREVEGIARDILEACDIVAEIPMAGKKESLNVSVATGILLYRLFDR